MLRKIPPGLLAGLQGVQAAQEGKGVVSFPQMSDSPLFDYLGLMYRYRQIGEILDVYETKSNTPKNQETEDETDKKGDAPSKADVANAWIRELMTPLRDSFSYAVPTELAIDIMKGYIKKRPVIDLGAGTGYWSMKLKKAGVSVVPADKSPLDRSFYSSGGARVYFTSVFNANESILSYFARWVLLLVYPPSGPMAAAALQEFKGRYVIFVGNKGLQAGAGGFPQADEDFFRILKEKFVMKEQVALPSHCFSNDAVSIFKRKQKAKAAQKCNLRVSELGSPSDPPKKDEEAMQAFLQTHWDSFLSVVARWQRGKGCAHCNKAAAKNSKLLTCQGCKAFLFCSKECQKAVWKQHKAVCKMLSKPLAGFVD
uniref:MYND-type domain-containing protein n=1 Tax=Chromera velia CCMP2878 TaxID=1169474 RepID=A0A0G4GBZ9_9ALVE|eukprot:Cvel_4478.t1-p1 / transcript=Cvel_4478.t1 / gene=Cvel_4478 / organism=Chromera_velia_CCMP2878 / gene_product=hypothetical protein / transcript_product=hypothetical protein / location=Cvel_scaffold196:2011-3114(-) / protein_length=368 / sequence_SO=supercontig / SO=protein_coding / is_pseudo=false